MSERFIEGLAEVTYGIRDGRSISVEEFFDTTQLHPTVTEQIRIGAYLDRLDSLITLHQRELDVLKRIKKSCLSKMFV